MFRTRPRNKKQNSFGSRKNFFYLFEKRKKFLLHRIQVQFSTCHITVQKYKSQNSSHFFPEFKIHFGGYGGGWGDRKVRVIEIRK